MTENQNIPEKDELINPTETIEVPQSVESAEMPRKAEDAKDVGVIVPEDAPKKKNKALKIVLLAVVAVMIIAAGVFFIFPEHIDYMIAEHKFNSGDYEKARLAYWDLGNFKDSEEKVLLCHEGIGDNYMAEGNYEDAAVSYDMAGNKEKRDEAYYKWAQYYVEYASYKNAIEKYEEITTRDVSEEIKEAEYLYFSSVKDDNDVLLVDENYFRFKALADSGYKDAKEIFDKAYAWDVKVYLSDEENDYTFETQYKINFNDKDSVSRKSKMYFAICLEGGVPGEELKMYYRIALPNAETKKETFTLCPGEYICPYFWYTSPSNAPTGNGTLKIYNAKTDKLLFTKKFKVTK